MNKKFLLLGAAGFVGTNVSDYFKEKGLPLDKTLGSTEHDLRDVEAARNLIHTYQPDYIINCAAHVGSLNYVTEKAADVLLDNTRMMLNLYQALSELKKDTVLINPIANCAYPANSDTFIEDEWMNGHLHRSVLSYGATRRMLWHTGESFYMQHGIKSIYLLVPNMYGPNDSTDPNKAHALNALISKFVKAEKEGREEIEIWGTGIAIREWLYARDFARIMELIVTKKITMGLDEPVNIGQNFGLSVRELVTIINEKYDNKFKIRWNHSMPDGAPKKVMDDVKFKHTFKDFEFTNFQEGIEKTIAFYNSIYPY
jgi:GDP-L-fucose synthase